MYLEMGVGYNTPSIIKFFFGTKLQKIKIVFMFQLICIIIFVLKKLKIELNSFNDRVSMKNTVKILILYINKNVTHTDIY